MNKRPVIVAGSRKIKSQQTINGILDPSKELISEVICGEAPGVDTLGRRWAEANSIPIKSFPAQWDKLGKKAGFIRNEQMAKYAKATNGILVIVWDGISPGSAHMKRTAEKYQIEILEQVVTVPHAPRYVRLPEFTDINERS